MPENQPPKMTGEIEYAVKIKVTPQGISYETLGGSESVHPYMAGQVMGAMMALANKEANELVAMLKCSAKAEMAVQAFRLGVASGARYVSQTTPQESVCQVNELGRRG